MSSKQAPVRVVTANIQSTPVDALTQDQALEDLARNAEIGDLVLLQEIATRYRPLVAQAFPAPEWTVYYGRPDNQSPIAFRRDLFARVGAHVTLLHPAVEGRHPREYTTHLRLRQRQVGCDLHVLNLHLVSGAFNDKHPDRADRLREWDEGIAGHQALVARLVSTGAPVVGGGDYNRRLRDGHPIGDEVEGSRVRYAVDAGSIDLIWFIDGHDAGWAVRATDVYPGRGHRDAQRNSDHSARRATVVLTQEAPMHKPFDRTTYGDVDPKVVDWKTRAALEEAEARLGYRLTLVQGSYNAGKVRQSGGTHDGGGVVDLLAWDWKRKVRVLRALGFAAWYRPTVPGLWGEHIHAVMVDHGRLSPAAHAQVEAYRAGRDGLKSNRADTFWRPDPIPVFSYPPKTPEPQPTPDPDPTPEPAYPPKRRLDGVDTSHHQQGRIDLDAARADGLKWWYLKATEGSSFVDPTYKRRVRQARHAGVPVGAYHFARPDAGDAATEARFFLDTADIRAGDMLPMVDLESTEGLSVHELTTWTGTWVRTIVAQLAAKGLAGRPIIYTPFDLERGFGCLCWVARYSDDFRAPVVPKPWRRAAIWQHSNGKFGPVKSVPGFGPVDVNAVHPDLPLTALQVRRAGPAPVPAPIPAPIEAPAPAPVARIPAAANGVAAPTSLVDVRLALVTAARSIEAAIDGLPER